MVIEGYERVCHCCQRRTSFRRSAAAFPTRALASHHGFQETRALRALQQRLAPDPIRVRYREARSFVAAAHDRLRLVVVVVRA